MSLHNYVSGGKEKAMKPKESLILLESLFFMLAF
jgi:hypothetical protein